MAVIVHHPVSPAVKKHFQLTGHVAPVARRANHQAVAFLHQAQDSLGVVFGHDTFVGAAAFHAGDTRAKFQLADVDNGDFGAIFKQGVAYDVQHLADVSVFTRARVQNDNLFHCFSNLKKISLVAVLL